MPDFFKVGLVIIVILLGMSIIHDITFGSKYRRKCKARGLVYAPKIKLCVSQEAIVN